MEDKSSKHCPYCEDQVACQGIPYCVPPPFYDVWNFDPETEIVKRLGLGLGLGLGTGIRDWDWGWGCIWIRGMGIGIGMGNGKWEWK